MIDASDISENDPRIPEVAEILLKAGERGVYSAARAAIAWHENQTESLRERLGTIGISNE